MNEAKELAEIVMSGRLSVLWPTLVTIFIAIVGTSFFSRIKKSAELKAINTNFENVIEQQRKLVEQSESIKQTLNKDSIFYQIQLSSYREKSVESIDLVYIELLALKNSAKDTSFLMGQDQCDNFVRSISSFRKLFEEHQIWIPPGLAVKIENLAIEIDNRCHKYIFASKRLEAPQYRSREQIDKLCDVQEQFQDYINKEIRTIFDNLVTEIHAEFGGVA